MTDTITDKDTWSNYISMLLDDGCKILFSTIHFGKPYIYIMGPDGKQFIERVPDAMLVPEVSEDE